MPPRVPEGQRPPVVVYPTDFSSEAEVAEAEAVGLARALGAELLLLHVSVETMLYGETPFGAGQLEKVYRAQAEWAEARLTDQSRRLTAESVRTRWRRCTGLPYEEIVRVANEERAAYIVMSTHGRGGFQRLMLGSVTDRVVRTARCPVLTVRPPATSA